MKHLLVSLALAGCASDPPPTQRARMGVASAYRISGIVTLTFSGNPHQLEPGFGFQLEDSYGIDADRDLFPPGPKIVKSAPYVDVLTYEEAGEDGNAAGSLWINRN